MLDFYFTYFDALGYIGENITDTDYHLTDIEWVTDRHGFDQHTFLYEQNEVFGKNTIEVVFCKSKIVMVFNSVTFVDNTGTTEFEGKIKMEAYYNTLNREPQRVLAIVDVLKRLLKDTPKERSEILQGYIEELEGKQRVSLPEAFKKVCWNDLMYHPNEKVFKIPEKNGFSVIHFDVIKKDNDQILQVMRKSDSSEGEFETILKIPLSKVDFLLEEEKHHYSQLRSRIVSILGSVFLPEYGTIHRFFYQ